MSKETLAWLNTNTLIGFTDKRGTAWHYRADEQGDEPNHYPGAVPLADVERRLFFWEAQRADVSATVLTPDGVLTVTDSERVAIVRPDTASILGVFKSGYQIHGYKEWLADNVATILDDDLRIGSAGLLKGGAVAWVSVEVPDTITTPEGVAFRPNLLATTSLDGSLATTYKRVVTAVVCDNTLSLALSEDKSQQVKVKHSAKSLGRISEVRDALAIVYTIADDFARQVAELCQTTVTDAQWSAFLDAHVPTKGREGRALTMASNKRDALSSLWQHDARVSPWKNTAFGVLQADNTYRQHVQTVRGSERSERNALNAIDGTVDREDREVLSTLSAVLV